MLEIFSPNENVQNFGLTVDELYVHSGFCDFDALTESFKFFSKLKIRKKLKISLIAKKPGSELEKLSLILLRNTSKEIENIVMDINHLTEIYVRNYMDEIKERKNLKQLIIDEMEANSHLLSVNSMNTIFSCKLFSNYSFIKDSDFSAESFKAIESLTIQQFRYLDRTKQIFKLIDKLNLGKIKKLCLNLLKPDYFQKDYRSLFERCLNTEELEINDGNFFKLPLKPFTKTLKILKLNTVTFDKKTQCENFAIFISNSFLLSNISFSNLKIEEYDFFESFETLKNTITSFSFSLQKSHNEKDLLLCLSKTIKKFSKIEIFRLNARNLTMEISENICESLLSSYKSLRNFTVFGYKKNIENCPYFFELLKNCEKLHHIHVDFLFQKKRLVEFFSILKKFKDISCYINWKFNFERKIRNEFFDILSECDEQDYVDLDYINIYDDDAPEKFEKYSKNSKYKLLYANRISI